MVVLQFISVTSVWPKKRKVLAEAESCLAIVDHGSRYWRHQQLPIHSIMPRGRKHFHGLKKIVCDDNGGIDALCILIASPAAESTPDVEQI